MPDHAPEFIAFPKMARLSRQIIITEKIDGTNAQVFVGEDGSIRAGSRTRWITPDDDNFGFAAWVNDHAGDLLELGPGRHYGEWWGRGIQRGYGQNERRFSLFNSSRWGVTRPICCDVVPVLYDGPFHMAGVDLAINRLRTEGSVAAPGFMRPEGVIVFHTAMNAGFKKTLERDDMPKGVVA